MFASWPALSAPFAVLVGGDDVVVVGYLKSGGIFVLIGLASFPEVGVPVCPFLFTDDTLRG